jgi:nitrilase
MTSLRVAAVQANYVLMDRAATLERVAALTAAAAGQGAQLVAFPEVFVPGTPIWIDTRPIWDGDEDWFRLLAENAVVVPGPAAERLGGIARDNEVWLVIGVEEREQHGGTIYNTVLGRGVVVVAALPAARASAAARRPASRASLA